MLPSLSDLVELFSELGTEEKVDVLIQYGDALQPLAPEHAILRDAGMHMIHECRAPVFLYVEIDDGVMRVYGDVPREAPVARGFVALLVSVFADMPVPKQDEVPPDLVSALGLHEVLSMQRRRGLGAVYRAVYRHIPLAFDGSKR